MDGKEIIQKVVQEAFRLAQVRDPDWWKLLCDNLDEVWDEDARQEFLEGPGQEIQEQAYWVHNVPFWGAFSELQEYLGFSFEIVNLEDLMNSLHRLLEEEFKPNGLEMELLKAFKTGFKKPPTLAELL